MKLLFIAVFSLVGSILLIGLCYFLHGYLMPWESPLGKYKIYKAITMIDMVNDTGAKIVSLYYFFFTSLLFFVLFVLLSGLLRWIAIIACVFIEQAPYFMVSLSLRQINDENMATMDLLDIKHRYRVDVVGDSMGIGLLSAFQATTINGEQSAAAMLIGAIVACATIAIAIWLVNGGAGRLLKKLSRQLKKLAYKPKFRFTPVTGIVI